MHEDYERARNLDGGAAGGTTENCGRQGKAEKEAEWTTGGGGAFRQQARCFRIFGVVRIFWCLSWLLGKIAVADANIA